MPRMRYAVILVLATCCSAAFGDEVRPAFLQITEIEDSGKKGYEILWKQPAVAYGRLAIDPVFPKDCVLIDQGPPEITASALIRRWKTTCDLRHGQIHISGLSVTLTDVMVRFIHADGDTSNYLLRPENPTLNLSDQAVTTLSYLLIGIEHLLFSIDHVLFIVGLVLFIREPWALLKTITAFTLAHSVSLALSIFGWVRLEQGPVEAVIALSILFLARELITDEDHRSRLTLGRPWVMAGLFGLLHGLGFAGALKGIGLPEDTLWLALLLFNVGIELGQLMIIATLIACTWVATKFVNLTTVTRIGAYGMGCLAAFWTIDRTLILM